MSKNLINGTFTGFLTFKKLLNEKEKFTRIKMAVILIKNFHN